MKPLFTICLLLFAAITTQAQSLKPYKADNGKYGFRDETTKTTYPAMYDDAFGLSENMYAVKLNDKYRIVDGTTGKPVTPVFYDDVDFFGEGVCMIEKNGKRGLLNKKGKEVIIPKYDDIGGSSEGFVWFQLGDKYGFAEVATGKEIIPAIYDQTHSFKEGKARVKKDGREFYIDKTGKEITANAPKDNNGILTGSAALPPQFYSQFKTLLTADWSELKGDYKRKKSDEWSDTYYYKCKKTLDGFQTEYYERQEDVFLLGATAWKTDGNAQLFQQIKTGIEKLKAEGYSLNGTESNLVRISKDGNPKAVVQFDNKNHIRFDFFKGSRKDAVPSLSNNNSNKLAPTNTGNYNQLVGIWNVSVKDKKYGLPDNFKIEIKKIINGKAEVWMLSDGKPYKQYKDFEIIKKENGSLEFVFQFSHDEKKIQKGTGTVSGNLIQMNGTQITPLSGTSMQVEDWIAQKESGTNTPNNSNKPMPTNTGNYTDKNTNTSVSNTISIPANSSAAVPEPMESKFRKAFNAAANSKARGAAGATLFREIFQSASLTEAQKISYMSNRLKEIYALDFDAVYYSIPVEYNDSQQIKNFFKNKILTTLTAQQQQAIRQKAQQIANEIRSKYNK